ncbi:MAG: internal scaffolding protein [Microviridae sp.]|nr:MAG: internal scaffolding protein [Microviridae sp.]
MEFQSAYSVPVRTSDLDCSDPSLAQQQFKDDVDINVLLERFKVTGVIPQGVRIPTYGDFIGISDFRQASDAVLAAKNAFMDIPASVRARFENDPAKFIDFCADPANLPELRKLGLAPEVVEASKGSGGHAPQVGGEAPAA